jgi:excisionase family DNA binding protein
MRHFTVREVAEQLGIAPTTVYAMCQRKLIPHVRLGTGRGAIRISEEALAEYLDGATVRQEGPLAPQAKVTRKHRKD